MKLKFFKTSLLALLMLTAGVACKNDDPTDCDRVVSLVQERGQFNKKVTIRIDGGYVEQEAMYTIDGVYIVVGSRYYNLCQLKYMENSNSILYLYF